MPQNSHGIMMSPSALTAWGWDEGTVLWLLEPPARRPLCSHGYGEELLLLNEAKALAGLHPVCYTNNTEKSPFLRSQEGIENHFPWQRPKGQSSPHVTHTLFSESHRKDFTANPKTQGSPKPGEGSDLQQDTAPHRTHRAT